MNLDAYFDIIWLVTLDFLPLKTEYLEEVLEIEKLSFPQPWTRGMFEREISVPISHFFIAKISGKIIVYGGYWQVEDEAHIINIAVHPDFRNKGFGREILGFLIETIIKQGLNRVLLEVRESNLAARKLYEANGFKIVGFRSRYYNDEDAVLMIKTIKTVKSEE